MSHVASVQKYFRAALSCVTTIKYMIKNIAKYLKLKKHVFAVACYKWSDQVTNIFLLLSKFEK